MGHTLAALAAIMLLALVAQDAFEVMLLPRRVQRRIRFMRFYFETSWAAWSRLALRLPFGARRERFLSIYGALSMVMLFAIWAGGLIAGFGALDWAAEGRATLASAGNAFYLSGVTFFTLGYGDVVPRVAAARLAAVVEAGTGLGFIAAVIGYLPVLYQLFSRREAHVIQLDVRAGSPPTAATMLRRHAESDGPGKLDDLLREWETWGAELIESHLTYPMLVYYRSQHDNQSWLAALTAIMDVCALILVGLEDFSALQARMTFTMARQAIVEMAKGLGVGPSRYDGGDRLPHEAYARLEALLAEATLRWNAVGAEETLAALRATYEPLLDGLAKRLLLPLPGWLPAEDAADHWERGPRGLIARRLIDQLSARAPPAPPPPSGVTRAAQRLRARLRLR
jgi:hypothetical protein